MNEIVRKPPQALDGFADFDLSTADGDTDRQPSVSRLLGTVAKFTNDADWILRTGEVITGQEFLVVALRRTEVKWGEAAPLEVIELGPGDKYRDLDSLNADIPQSEWRMGPNGKMQGPWARQHVAEMVDAIVPGDGQMQGTMRRISWPTSTIGGEMAIRDLRDQIMLMRKFRGNDVYPTVELTSTFMPTKFGGRLRPHLPIKGWTRAGGGGEPIAADAQPPQLPPTPPTPAATAAPPPKPAADAQKPEAVSISGGAGIDGLIYIKQSDGSYVVSQHNKVLSVHPTEAEMWKWLATRSTVAAVTLKEELQDKVPW